MVAVTPSTASLVRAFLTFTESLEPSQKVGVASSEVEVSKLLMVMPALLLGVSIDHVFAVTKRKLVPTTSMAPASQNLGKARFKKITNFTWIRPATLVAGASELR